MVKPIIGQYYWVKWKFNNKTHIEIGKFKDNRFEFFEGAISLDDVSLEGFSLIDNPNDLQYSIKNGHVGSQTIFNNVNNKKECQLPNGCTLHWKDNGAGGRIYYSDESGGDIFVWDSCLVAESTLLCAMTVEAGLAYREYMEKGKK